MKYEVLYIVPTQYTEPEVEGVMKSVAALLEKEGATVGRHENLGKIRLAYPIKHVRHGSYVLAHFDAPETALKEIDHKIKLVDAVLRHTVLRLQPGAETRKFSLISYVAPLSEEARTEAAPRRRPMGAAQVAAPLRNTAAAAEGSISMEELDKKLDEILDEGSVDKGV